jgi:hypothetical protein
MAMNPLNLPGKRSRKWPIIMRDMNRKSGRAKPEMIARSRGLRLGLFLRQSHNMIG